MEVGPEVRCGTQGVSTYCLHEATRTRTACKVRNKLRNKITGTRSVIADTPKRIAAQISSSAVGVSI